MQTSSVSGKCIRHHCVRGIWCNIIFITLEAFHSFASTARIFIIWTIKWRAFFSMSSFFYAERHFYGCATMPRLLRWKWYTERVRIVLNIMYVWSKDRTKHATSFNNCPINTIDAIRIHKGMLHTTRQLKWCTRGIFSARLLFLYNTEQELTDKQ